MEQRLDLVRYGSQLWGKDEARRIRGRAASILETLNVGDVLVIDAVKVDAFDFSFAAELFGKALLTMGVEFPGRFFVVENLNECTRENLQRALESLNTVMIERKGGDLALLGKVQDNRDRSLRRLQSVRRHEPLNAHQSLAIRILC
jgi:hypothetical protein